MRLLLEHLHSALCARRERQRRKLLAEYAERAELYVTVLGVRAARKRKSIESTALCDSNRDRLRKLLLKHRPFDMLHPGEIDFERFPRRIGKMRLDRRHGRSFRPFAVMVVPVNPTANRVESILHRNRSRRLHAYKRLPFAHRPIDETRHAIAEKEMFGGSHERSDRILRLDRPPRRIRERHERRSVLVGSPSCLHHLVWTLRIVRDG